MKTIIKTVFMMCCVGFLPTLASAQQKVIIEEDAPNGVVMVTLDKAGDEIIRIMNESQLPYIHDPKAPRFLLMDKRGKFALGIGGYVRGTAEYDFGGIVDNVDFYPGLIPNNGKVNNQFQMDITTSRIFLKLVGHSKVLGDFVVYTAGDFRGGSGKLFRMVNAYITFRDITAGYTYGSFMDLAALPPTIDFAGPNGSTFYRATQLSYTFNKIKNLKLHASVEVPTVEGTTTSGLDIGPQRMPNLVAYAQYGWNDNSHIRLGGLYRNITYTSTQSDKAHGVSGYGIQASTTFTLGSKWQLFGQATYGKGIGEYLNDLSNLNVDIVPDPQNEGKMQVLPMMGWFAGVQYNLCSKMFLSTSYSASRLYSENGYPSTQPDYYKYGQYLVTNAFWNVTSNMQVGAEYLHGWRTNYDGATKEANRVNLLVQYSF